VPLHLALSKDFFLKNLCRVSFQLSTRQRKINLKILCRVPSHLALGKLKILCRVPSHLALGKATFFLKFFAECLATWHSAKLENQPKIGFVSTYAKCRVFQALHSAQTVFVAK
jgi:hypothetical protein